MKTFWLEKLTKQDQTKLIPYYIFYHIKFQLCFYSIFGIPKICFRRLIQLALIFSYQSYSISCNSPQVQMELKRVNKRLLCRLQNILPRSGQLQVLTVRIQYRARKFVAHFATVLDNIKTTNTLIANYVNLYFPGPFLFSQYFCNSVIWLRRNSFSHTNHIVFLSKISYERGPIGMGQ